MAGSKGRRKHPRVREAPAEGYGPPASPPSQLSGVLLDSDVIIDVLRGRRPTTADLVRTLRTGVKLFCCAVSLAEIYAGLRSGEEAMTDDFFQRRGEVVLDAGIGRRAGTYLARFSRSHGLEVPDALIAAAATCTGLRLWTLNRRDYPMADLRFFSP